jgi:hypothetical protein
MVGEMNALDRKINRLYDEIFNAQIEQDKVMHELKVHEKHVQDSSVTKAQSENGTS